MTVSKEATRHAGAYKGEGLTGQGVSSQACQPPEAWPTWSVKEFPVGLLVLGGRKQEAAAAIDPRQLTRASIAACKAVHRCLGSSSILWHQQPQRAGMFLHGHGCSGQQ